MRRLPHPMLAVFLACLAPYLAILLGGGTLPARDLGATQVPWRAVWRSQVLSGTPPVWDPLSNQGRPLLANPNAMAAYPGSLLFLVLPAEEGVVCHLALHHLILALGCYRLARRTGAAPGAAAVGAAVAATGGLAWSAATFLNVQAALAWMPWVAAAALPAPASGAAATRRALAGGALTGLVFLAGEPVAAGLAAVAWTAVVIGSWPGWRRRGMAVAGLAAAALAGPVLVPLLATFPDTVRGSLGVAPGALAADTLAPRRLPELLLPHLLGEPLGDAEAGFWAAPSFPWQRYYPLIFLGSAPLLLLPFAAGRRRLAPFLGLFAGALLGSAALAVPAVARLLGGLPLVSSLRFGIKLLNLLVCALPPLVAAGYAGLAARRAGSGRRACVIALAAVAIATPLAVAPDGALRPLLAALYPASRASLARTATDELREGASLDLLALALPPATLLAAGAGGPVAAAVAVAGVLGGHAALPSDSAAAWRQPPPAFAAAGPEPVVAALAASAAPAALPEARALARFWTQRAALQPSYASRWGGRYVLVRGPDGLEPFRQELLAAAGEHLRVAERAALARSLGATAVVTVVPLPGWSAEVVDGVWLSRPDRVAPGAYLARREVPAAGPVAAAQALAASGFVAGSDAVVEGLGGVHALAAGSLVERSGAPHRRRFTVTAEGPALLVVQQSYMRCWRARVDGAAAVVEPVNGAGLGVRVATGRHDVELAIDPRPYRAGLLGPVLLLIAWGVTRRRTAWPDRAAPSGATERTSPPTPPAP